MGKMFVVTHKRKNTKIRKDYDFYFVNSIVNNFINEKYNDAKGVNISLKNNNFCELTALYSIWKNDCDSNLGLCHYRRFFYSFNLLNNSCISTKKLDRILKKYDIVKPYCSIVLESNIYEFYKKNHIIKDLEVALKILSEKYPEYKDISDFYFFKNRKASFLNMFYTSPEIFTEYCKRIFPILFECENQIKLSGRDDYQKRVFGFLAEHLFNVWILKKKLTIKYLSLRCLTNSYFYDFLYNLKNKFFKSKYMF